MKAYELLDTPERWIQGDNARNLMGDPCHPDAPDACQWSLFGALCRTSVGPTEVLSKVAAVQNAVGVAPCGLWNDAPERTYGDVFMLLLELEL